MKIFLTICFTLAVIATYAGDRTACPMLQKMSTNAQGKMVCPMLQNTVDPHAAGVDQRGDHAMGFSHETTKHHFKLMSDGGAIEVDADNEADTTTLDQIRQHLTHIASMFSAGNFEMPMFIHDTVPAGIPVMKEKHGTITYTFQPTSKGAMVRIATHDPDALKAIHQFLAFQIEDHRTGDSTSVEMPSPGNRP
jgi:hypothetical protein